MGGTFVWVEFSLGGTFVWVELYLGGTFAGWKIPWVEKSLGGNFCGWKFHWVEVFGWNFRGGTFVGGIFGVPFLEECCTCNLKRWDMY